MIGAGDIRQRNLGALFGERHRISFTDLATAAGYDHGFIFKTHNRLLLWEIMKAES
jgi:hypothetical protein